MTDNTNELRERYLRPIKYSVLLSMLGEFIIFVVWGVILFPEGSLLNKLLWTVFFCGLGMGSAVGAVIAVFFVDKLRGSVAIVLSSLVSAILLGGFCNYLCLKLDQHFLYFGGHEASGLFIINGMVMSALAGALVGWLCFTDNGQKVRII